MSGIVRMQQVVRHTTEDKDTFCDWIPELDRLVFKHLPGITRVCIEMDNKAGDGKTEFVWDKPTPLPFD